VFNLVILFSCTLATTKSKPPAFYRPLDSVSRDINAVIRAEKMHLNGTETTSNGERTSELTIEIVDPRNIPDDTALLSKVIKRIAAILKHSLKDTASYTTYRVLFVKQPSSGPVTKSDYFGQVHKSGDLNDHIYITTLGDKFDSETFRAVGKRTFTRNDSSVVTVISDYNFNSDSPLIIKMLKKTDSANILVTKRNMGIMRHGNSYMVNNWRVSDFYSIPELNSGAYWFEYLLNDSIIGTEHFEVQ
jgi:hypothetical protein